MLCKVSMRGVIHIALVFLGLGVLADGAQAQMAIPGQFSVSPVGSATYSIPIQVPPGISEMEPKLTLGYDSRNPNGVLGVGWGLGGLPTIYRCKRTTPQDGVKGTVMYDAADRFCMGGQRLIVVKGVYGSADSEYRTEIESFAKVTAYSAAAGGGPSYFIVQTRDGQTMQFGKTSDSSVMVAGKTPAVVRIWALNKISDVHGNSLSVSYQQPVAGAYYVDRIDYTSNSATGLVAKNSVSFGYSSARTDVIVGYQGGYPFTVDRLLTSITTKTGGDVVSIYTVAYDTSLSQARMKSITLCTPTGVCAPATSMRFAKTQSLGPATIESSAAESSVEEGGRWLALDADGDGRTDLIHLTTKSGDMRVWRSKGDGAFDITQFANTVDTSLLDGDWRLLDVNNDGLADMVHMKNDSAIMYVWISNGNGTFAITPFSTAVDPVLFHTPSSSVEIVDEHAWQLLDVNGDGLVDLVHQRYLGVTSSIGNSLGGRHCFVWISNGDGTFTVTDSKLSEGRVGYDRTWKAIDVNGDGLTDLVQLMSGTGGMRIWKSKGDGTFAISGYSDGVDAELSSGSWRLLDINGDGLTDLFHITSGSGEAKVWASKGDGTFSVSKFTSTIDKTLSTGAWFTLDVNGDGLTDLVHAPPEPDGGYYYWTSKGDGTFNVSGVDKGVIRCNTGCAFGLEGDFRGDGAGGFVRLVSGTSSAISWVNLWGMTSQYVPEGISTGFGDSISWSMATLPQILGVRYIKELASNAAVRTVVPPMSVVTRAAAGAGKPLEPDTSGPAKVTSYVYGSARTEINGRGFLGFDWVQSTDSFTNLITRTYFRQDFPYTGSIRKIGTGSGSTDSWNNLKLTITNYDQVVLEGPRYFIYPRQIDSETWDLKGIRVAHIRSTNTDPDNYGNFGTVKTEVFNSTGSATEYSKTAVNTYDNDVANWRLGRMLKSVETVSGPTVPAVVTPGSGGLPAAPTPTLSPAATATLMSILTELLLSD